jgi:hypothetical protein
MVVAGELGKAKNASVTSRQTVLTWKSCEHHSAPSIQQPAEIEGFYWTRLSPKGQPPAANRGFGMARIARSC